MGTPNSVLRDYDANLDFRSVTTITGINTSDADSLVVSGSIGVYGGYSGITYEGASLTRIVAYGSSGSDYVAVWHLPNCPKAASGTLTFTGTSGYSWWGNVAVCNGCIVPGNSKQETVTGAAYSGYTLTISNGKLNDYMFAHMVGSNIYGGDGTILYAVGGGNIAYRSGCSSGDNSLSVTRGSPGGYVIAAGAYFSPKGVIGVMMFIELWKEKLYKKLINQGAVPIGLQI